MGKIIGTGKQVLSCLVRNQSGQGALAIVLILLIVGGMILPALLAFMSTGLKAGQMHEARTEELYSADAGMEDALLKIKNKQIPDDPYDLPTTINNKKVKVTLEERWLLEGLEDSKYGEQPHSDWVIVGRGNSDGTYEVKITYIGSGNKFVVRVGVYLPEPFKYEAGTAGWIIDTTGEPIDDPVSRGWLGGTVYTWDWDPGKGPTFSAKDSEVNVFAVGNNGAICHYYKNWDNKLMPSGTGKDLYGVWGSYGTDVFAVGSSGTILHYNGTAWSSSVEAAEDLNGIWGSAADDVFAVGNSGTILHYNGTTWTSMTSGTTADLHGVWGSYGTNVFAVGSSGTILHYNGSEWNQMRSGTEVLNGVWGSAWNDVYAVGSSGTILHYDGNAGNAWSSMSAPSGTPALHGVWGSSWNDTFAVGSLGTILHYDGTTWTSMTSGTTEDLQGVWGSSGSDVFAVGNSGTLLNYDGIKWSGVKPKSPTNEDLHSVWGTFSGDTQSLTFNFTPADGTPTEDFAWVKFGPHDIYLVWDANIRRFNLVSQAKDPVSDKLLTQIESDVLAKSGGSGNSTFTTWEISLY